VRTDDLIAVLSTSVEPVDRGHVTRMIGMAVLIGAVAAVGIIVLALGVRTDLDQENALIYLPLKVLFTLQIVVLATLAVTKLARPGGERTTPIGVAAVPLIVLAVLGAVGIAAAPREQWAKLIVGDRWLECLISIPIIAIVPFAFIVLAVRRMGPTDLTRTGALAGLVAGGVSATAYALHCSDDSLPFVAVWYGGTMTLCTLAGAILGPRLLRW
jgi:hypothetical protein